MLRLPQTPLVVYKTRRAATMTATCHSQGPWHARAAAATGTSAAAAAQAAAREAAAPPSLQQTIMPDGERANARLDNTPLGAADLEAYCQQRGISATLVPPLDGRPPPLGCVEVKSLVFLVNSHPLVSRGETGRSLAASLPPLHACLALHLAAVLCAAAHLSNAVSSASAVPILAQVVVLPLAARVDEKRLASLLHTGRNQVRLAPAASLVQLCGYSGAPWAGMAAGPASSPPPCALASSRQALQGLKGGPG